MLAFPWIPYVSMNSEVYKTDFFTNFKCAYPWFIPMKIKYYLEGYRLKVDDPITKNRPACQH